MSKEIPERYGIKIQEPFVEPLIKCPNCGDNHYEYCKVRTKGKVHYCFKCRKEFIPIKDDSQEPLPPEFASLELIPDNIHLPTSLYPEGE